MGILDAAGVVSRKVSRNLCSLRGRGKHSMNCRACGKPAPAIHDTYHFAGQKSRRFYVCSDVCWWRVEMRQCREEASR